MEITFAPQVIVTTNLSGLGIGELFCFERATCVYMRTYGREGTDRYRAVDLSNGREFGFVDDRVIRLDGSLKVWKKRE